jgi:hypothetical protein
MTSTLVKKYGHMWARNLANIARLKKQTGDGVYVLYDGSLPVYVGMGNISSRIKKARNSKRRGQMWDQSAVDPRHRSVTSEDASPPTSIAEPPARQTAGQCEGRTSQNA